MIEIAQRCASHLATGRFGAEPAGWYGKILRPILNGFVESFAEGGKGGERFWKGIVDRHVPDGSGRVTYSGWITGFCYWDEGGTVDNCNMISTMIWEGGGGFSCKPLSDSKNTSPGCVSTTPRQELRTMEEALVTKCLSITGC